MRQTNILSAAFVIMATVIFSQILGLVRQRLLVSIFGASDILGVYLAAARIPEFLFQLIIAGALSSAFIPLFSNYLAKNKEKEGYIFASNLLVVSLAMFFCISVVLMVFAEFFCHLVAPGYSGGQITLMANLMRIIIAGEMLFIIGSFLSAILQSYDHFFIPGIASAMYNLGMIISIFFFSPFIGIHAAAYGVGLGAAIFVLLQLPMMKKVGFTFRMNTWASWQEFVSLFKLMWPRTVSIAIFQFGTLFTVTLTSYLSSPGRNYVILDYAQTLAFAPVVLFGQTIAQAAFPVLSRERERLPDFKVTFLTSFKQMLFLILPFSVLFFVLRIPIVRLVYGASQFDWEATRLTGKTLALFSVSMFAQSLIYLVSRGFYALYDTITPLVIGAISTLLMIVAGSLSILYFHQGVEAIALSYSFASIVNLVLLLLILDRKTQGFEKWPLAYAMGKIFFATLCTGVALYVPIKLLDRLVFDTTKTINLIMLTGISSVIGISLYVFLAWLFNVKEASMFILLFKRLGNWKEILAKTDEVIV